ncbi:MAG: hypothetical protein GX945_14625 [Lentisphaerae bacterium]|nr:hypothetical protein [Lentisphaerota bacterium]
MSTKRLQHYWGLALALALILPPAGLAQDLRVLARNENGMLCLLRGKRVLFVSGNAEQMGDAHGKLLAGMIPQVTPKTMCLVGAVYSISKGDWFFTRMDEIIRRATPHTPERFIQECLAMGRAAGISDRDALCANFFPELFHCSGAALRNQATSDGQVLHVRVLDYMADINLQKYTAVQIFLPEGHNAWMSLGYAGFLGTVTAMNEHGLAMGEIGGGGEGNWDGMPMTFLMRDIMERAKTVREALAILEKTPRSCEYYYVLSDAGKDMVGVYATPETLEILEAGQQHPKLPKVPADTVLISAPERAKTLAQRIEENYGKITPKMLMTIIKRPVAMKSNLHNAIFRPETLDMWFADAGRKHPACDSAYTRINLREAIDFFHKNR